MTPALPRKLAAVLMLGCLSAVAFAQMYPPPPNSYPPPMGSMGPMAYPPPGYPQAYPPPAPYYRPPYNPYMPNNPYMAMRPPMAPMPMPYPPGMMPMWPPMMVPPGAVPVSQGPATSPVPAIPTDAAPPISISPAPSTEAPAVQATPHVYKVLPQAPSSPIFQPTPDSATPGCGCGTSLPDPSCCVIPAPVCSSCLQSQGCNKGFGGLNFDVGGAASVLRPYFHSNPALFTSSLASLGPPVTVTGTSPEFDWKWTVNPTIWAEVRTCSGLGVRAQFFDFDQHSNDVIVTIPTPNPTTLQVSPAPNSPNPLVGGRVFVFGPSTNTASSDLKIETIDIEGTYSMRYCQWLITFQAGGRYLDTHQDYDFSSVSTTGAGLILSNTYRQSFTGAGPLFGIEFHRYFGCTGLSAYGKVDGALLVGNGSENFTQISPAFGVVVVNNNFHPLMTVADVELGAEYMFNHCGRFRPYIRAAVVDQTYWDIGNATSRNGNMSLFGGQLSGGITF